MIPLRLKGQWFSERRRLSHDWLGNRLLPKLRSLHNISLGEVEDPIAVQRAWQFLNSEWPSNADSIRRLLAACMDSVGPSAMIDNNPYLRTCEPAFRMLIAEVVDRDFRLNSTIRSDVSAAEKCLKHCEESYEEVASLLQTHNSSELGPELREPLARFGNACEELAYSLGRLPHMYKLPLLDVDG